MFTILANLIVLSSDYYGISKNTKRNLDIADFVFTLFFIGEIILRIWAKGIEKYVAKV
jgi:hypothetical protein